MGKRASQEQLKSEGVQAEEEKTGLATMKSKSAGKWAETFVPPRWHKQCVIFLSLCLVLL